jgi:hypothetical protein
MNRLLYIVAIVLTMVNLGATPIVLNIYSNYDADATVWINNTPTNGYDFQLFEGTNNIEVNIPSAAFSPPEIDVYIFANPIDYPDHTIHFSEFVQISHVQYPTPHYQSSLIWLTFTPFSPSDFNVRVYSNVEGADAEVVLGIIGNPYYTFTAERVLKKGWNTIGFTETTGFFASPDVVEAEVTVALEYSTAPHYFVESFTTTVNGFTYNEDTGKYENSESTFVFDNKPLRNKYNWVSFPKLERLNNDPVNAPNLFDNNIFVGFDYFSMIGGSCPGFTFHFNQWNDPFAIIQSSDGVIINMEEHVERVFVPSANATVLSPNTQVSLSTGENYIGYWMHQSQMLDEAFGDDWDKVIWVKSQDWFYRSSDEIRFGDDMGQPIVNRVKPLHYGEAYIVKLREPINNFSWNGGFTGLIPEEKTKAEPQHFEVEEYYDYEVVFFLDIPDGVQEIGVFQGDVCVGAVVVDDSAEQVLVYSQTNEPLDFELISGRNINKITQYQIYDESSDSFKRGRVRGGTDVYSIVSLKNSDSYEQNTLPVVSLHHNYPNPFNPTTTIAFSMQSEDNVELTIYNVKGQKVKNIFQGMLSAGEHQMVWNGTDDSSKAVGSGIYYYVLKTSTGNHNRKILLLK